MSEVKVHVYGAGLAGCEAAWQLAKRGIKVELFDIKPKNFTPAHSSQKFGELVCSNSLRAANIENAAGLLKEEMRRLGSLIMEAADKTSLPAGGALAVDREKFADYITEKVLNHPLISFNTKEINELDPDVYTIVATGPLTTEPLFDHISGMLGGENLHFFDAAAPIVSYESIDKDKVFMASRYGKGSADYVNCPMDKEEYEAFYNALISAETVQLHGFENNRVFEGCMPIEVMAQRGTDTIRFGPLKPVGLIDPKTGKEPYAVIQLRKDNSEGSLYNLVGFQTHLKFGEQKRVFSMIPGLENAEFIRYGVMHRNTFINSPKALDSFYRSRLHQKLFFAGQMTGVEGYIESSASGLLCGINMSHVVTGREPVDFPATTAIGALAHYISDESISEFQPMNVNFGIMKKPDFKFRGKKDKNTKLAARALEALDNVALQVWKGENA
ncbi:MAG: methylenetetrahydrofolate--tRNA-(uracil(54)-C(5))-methyltransferase (FADH(2)-oxidizing) TrmFO [Bacillota bacterium]|nr:methylenetetrahydrofolate--tRNA-(uracil(54)-C(5))-methyltransferase (FADH(2)-oxidizing) TrmFO [Bacillota bacterium]